MFLIGGDTSWRGETFYRASGQSVAPMVGPMAGPVASGQEITPNISSSQTPAEIAAHRRADLLVSGGGLLAGIVAGILLTSWVRGNGANGAARGAARGRA